MNNYEIRIAFQQDDELRRSFNILAEKTYGLSFEEWFQNGFWGNQYIPYSIIIENEVIANISVSLMDFICDGVEKHYIQLGTVMTDERYRKRGFSRMLMERILQDYRDSDGIYLFANDSVLHFYPRFGFRPVREYQYTAQIDEAQEGDIRKVPMEREEDWSQFLDHIKQKQIQDLGCMEMQNDGLLMFYLSSFMKDNVYHLPEQQAYIVAELERETLIIQAAFAGGTASLTEIARLFIKDVKKVALGFTPKDTAGFSPQVLQEENTTLFVLGKEWENWENDRRMFPLLSHA